MRRWLSALTCIRAGTVFSWCMKVNWSQVWCTMGCKLLLFWYSFTSSGVVSTVGLETSEHGAGRSSRGPRCHHSTRKGCSVPRKRSLIPKISSGIQVRKLHPTIWSAGALLFEGTGNCKARPRRAAVPWTADRVQMPLARHCCPCKWQRSYPRGCALTGKHRDAAGKHKYPMHG